MPSMVSRLMFSRLGLCKGERGGSRPRTQAAANQAAERAAQREVGHGRGGRQVAGALGFEPRVV